MTEIERLRNEYVDAAAKALIYRYDYEDMMKPMDFYTVQLAEITAARALLTAREETDHGTET